MATLISQQLQDLARTQQLAEAQNAQVLRSQAQLMALHEGIKAWLVNATRSGHPPSVATVGRLANLMATASVEQRQLGDILRLAIALPTASDPTRAHQDLIDAVAALPDWLKT